MPDYREIEVKKIDQSVASVKKKIQQFDNEIENAKRMLEHHPWHWGRERQKFQAHKNVELKRLASLIDRRFARPYRSGATEVDIDQPQAPFGSLRAISP